ncbi:MULTISPECIES: GntR family transcriptional regulator [Bacillaceae]|uniref:GntR family transcriptional regulator n=1 Tax=Bacillaceae TaxID=186817 RepID=UPI001BDDFA88|nr:MULTISPECIES: GntR family transcriptional regulator [Bacillaceae]MDX8360520.1 GntR family transcriptional regulator [Cytobacillus sp. IB215316]MDX8365822.1 GntR family transcriptional regulator [Cytobacillus sp. IB215665]
MFNLDLRSRQPIYEQLVDNIKQLIINEVLKPDEQLPSVRALAKQLTINPNTIQKAYRELEHQGYIYSVKGRGSFVTPSPQLPNQEKLEKMMEEIKKLLLEAFYLGMTKEQSIQLINEVEKVVKGGERYDTTK